MPVLSSIEICTLLGYYAVLCGDCFLMCQHNIPVTSSRVKSLRQKGLSANCFLIILMSWHLTPLEANFSSEHQKSWKVLHPDSTESVQDKSLVITDQTSVHRQSRVSSSIIMVEKPSFSTPLILRTNLPTGIIKHLCTDVASQFVPGRKICDEHVHVNQLAHHTKITCLAFFTCKDGFTLSARSLSVQGTVS
jgi:hypothetical protein